jgi:hypothetical protein
MPLLSTNYLSGNCGELAFLMVSNPYLNLKVSHSFGAFSNAISNAAARYTAPHESHNGPSKRV